MFREDSISGFFSTKIDENPDTCLQSLLCEICQAFEFTNATYFGASIPGLATGEYVLHTTYPEAWVEHYFEQEYENIDPILSAGSQSLLPLEWSIIPRVAPKLKSFFGEAAEFGIGKYGLTVPVHGIHSDFALLSVNSDTEIQDWVLRNPETLSDLTYLAHLFHHRVFIEKSDARYHASAKLTPREKEVLRWAAHGKTAWESAQIIGITEKTVSFYISNACTKLKVASKTHAVAKAISDRSIMF